MQVPVQTTQWPCIKAGKKQNKTNNQTNTRDKNFRQELPKNLEPFSRMETYRHCWKHDCSQQPDPSAESFLQILQQKFQEPNYWLLQMIALSALRIEQAHAARLKSPQGCDASQFLKTWNKWERCKHIPRMRWQTFACGRLERTSRQPQEKRWDTQK